MLEPHGFSFFTKVKISTTNGNMIYHIFNGQMMHLVPSIIQGINKNAHNISEKTEKEHFFCVNMFMDNVYKEPKQSPYEQLFVESGITHYKLLYSWKELLLFLVTAPSTDRFIFHSKFPAKVMLPFNLYALLFSKKKLENCSYVCWGSDYIFNGHSLLKRFHAKIMNKAFSSYKALLVLSKEDQREIQKYYSTAKVMYAPYVSANEVELLEKPKRMSVKPTVMVSHSGWPHNKHLNSFELLNKYAGQIKVICPLCYGEKEYIEEIITAGEKQFGEDYYYFTDLMPKEEYIKFILNNVDIYVSSAEVQTGLGAIFISLRCGLKVYATGNNYVSLKGTGFEINPLDDIKNEEFNEFISPYSLERKMQNITAINKRAHNPSVISIWKQVYE